MELKWNAVYKYIWAGASWLTGAIVSGVSRKLCCQNVVPSQQVVGDLCIRSFKVGVEVRTAAVLLNESNRLSCFVGLIPGDSHFMWVIWVLEPDLCCTEHRRVCCRHRFFRSYIIVSSVRLWTNEKLKTFEQLIMSGKKKKNQLLHEHLKSAR